MTEIELAPIKETPEYYEQIEAEIMRVLKKEIYLPLVAEAGQKKIKAVKNAMEDLLSAIAESRINFDHGYFRGKFSAVVSRELKKLGASWDRKQGAFSIPFSRLPVDVKQAIGVSDMRFEQAARRITKRLQEISPAEIAEKINFTRLFDKTVYKVNKKFEATIRGITVAPKLTDAERLRIAQDYAKNLELYITEFTQKETEELRERIQDRVARGYRYETVIKEIEQSYWSFAEKSALSCTSGNFSSHGEILASQVRVGWRVRVRLGMCSWIC